MDTIIFSRIWNPGLIRIALECARKHCPDCRVIHFHDETSGVGWDDSIDVGEQFTEAIKYPDSLPEESYSCFKNLQKVCLARWKVLADWMEVEGIDEVFHCDSDVLLFNDPFQSPHYFHGRLLLSDNKNGMCHAGNAMVPKTCVKEFWPFLQKMVTDGAFRDGHLSDMHVWTLLGALLGYYNQNQILDGVTFDHHMGYTGTTEHEEWESENGYKKLTWKDGHPYCRHLPSGADIRLLSLHCWGQAECHMAEYAAH